MVQRMNARRTTTIAIDPGSKSGVAIWRGDKLVAYGLVRSTAEEIEGKVAGLRELARAGGVELDGNRFRAEDEVLVVTEAQYLKAPPARERKREDGEDKAEASASGRFAAALSVATNAVVWRTLARVMRAKVVEPVQAATWRSTFAISAASGRPDLKKQAVDLVRDRLRVEVRDDVAEAILLGLHYHVSRLGAEIPAGLSWVLTLKLQRKAATARAKSSRRSNTTELF